MTEHFRFGFRSIRGKLTLAAVTPLVVILLLVALAASYLINAAIVDQTQQRVRNDLNAAHEVLNHEQQRVAEVVRFTAHGLSLVAALQSTDLPQLTAELEQIRRREQLDFLSLNDADGNPLLFDAQLSDATPLPFLLTALETGQFTGTVLISEAELQRQNPQLAAQARVYSSAQPAVPLERRGMFLVGARRILDAQGRLLGCLSGGIMLNNNLPLVDRISNLVYGQEQFDGTDVGSATIFLDRLRIATTIRLKDGQRALGTRVSDEVAEAVLQQGIPWLARAHVVNDWYLTAYEPIFDEQARSIGALYVGMLEAPFNALKGRSYLLLLALLAFGCLFGAALSHLLAQRLSRPIMKLASSAEMIASGEREVALPVAGQDEIGHLTEAFAGMTRALKQSDAELQRLNRQLEEKVVERTAQLEEKSRQLIRTQEKLLRSEKLAAIGSLAAGVAHEINNPAAIIRGNVEILQMGLAEEAPEREETREILKQVERVSRITQDLLSFSGQPELHPEHVQLGPLLQEILGQIRHQQPLEQVELIQQYAELPAIPGDRERLRQVFTNIILNALQAMAGAGRLTVTTGLEQQLATVTISDSGPGIPAELQEKVFNPFFTTKRQGTGLGLSVSYGIIQAHGGTLELDAEHAPGACFRISLPF